MNSFSFYRFGKALRWVWSMNFRSLMMWTTGFSLVIFFAEMMIWYLNNMLPASNLEKFLSVVLYFTVAWTVCIFLSIAVGDTLRMVFRSLVSGDEWVSCIPRFVDSFAPSFLYRSIYNYTLSYKVMQVVVLTAMILWTNSFYTLGATLVSYYQMEMFHAVWIGDHYVSQEVGTLGYVLAVVLPLLAVINYWASFHIFKGFQLITNKWTNYDILKR